MNKITTYKKSLIYSSIGVFVLIMYLTYQIIYQTKNWKWFDIDFSKDNNNAISAYGTLIGGILAFLSIIFVIYSILEQRQQILNEKIEKEKEEEIELLNKIKLLNSFCKSAIDNIGLQGEKLKEFYIKEKEFPTKLNKIFFTTNKNFSRVIDLDSLSMYKALNFHFKENSSNESLFLEIYSIFDFYYESLKELNVNFKIQFRSKFDELEKIGFKLDEFLNICIEFQNDYIRSTQFELNLGWTNNINEYKANYLNYLEKIEKEKEDLDFCIINKQYLSTFISNGKLLPQANNNINYNSSDLINIAIGIKNTIKRVELQSISYAEDVEKHFNEYYDDKSKNKTKLIKYRNKFNQLISSK